MGLAEAHQVLTLNNLRHRVTLRTDGGLRTGRDIVIAAILGAEEFGIGTASLVAMGCIMVRQCHSNTCPVGVCTQDESLRAKFDGTPEKVINLMTFIAEEVRQLLADLGFRTLNVVIGRSYLIVHISRGADHLDDLDLNPLLVRVDSPYPPYRQDPARIEVADTLDVQILRDADSFFRRGEKLDFSYSVRNTQRAIGARASSAVVQRYGMHGLPEARLTIRLRGSAGQSLGAFMVQGIAIDVTGESNDYVGKGLSGGLISLRPDAAFAEVAAENAIIGNTCLYGATSGKLFAAGLAGERFGVRNSGATAVIEGCGANGCEYMTGGAVVVLGAVGENFGAGMTGGMAFVYDAENRFRLMCNPDTITWRRIGAAHWDATLRALIEEHVERTGSRRGRALLSDWPQSMGEFWQVVPKEMLTRLSHPLDDSDAAGVAAE
jgi:glutamate synthase (NADPH/NADH) large chain